MPVKTNVTVEGVFENARGEGQYGEYIIYGINIGGDKYSYFGDTKGKKVPPVKGSVLAYVKYSEKQNGQYLNKTIEEFELAEPNKTSPVDNTPDFSASGGEVVQDGGKNIIPIPVPGNEAEKLEVPKDQITFYLGYAARLIANRPEVFNMNTKDMAEYVVALAKDIYTESQK